MTYDNTNSGALFRNDRREKQTQPHLTGSINIEGREYWLSGWIKPSDDSDPETFAKAAKHLLGNLKVISMSAKPKEERSGGQNENQQSKSEAFNDFDDEIPF